MDKEKIFESARKGMRVNNKFIQHKNIEKPCYKLGYCPYGQLVEVFNLRKKADKKISCKIFGHDCPVFFHAENIMEKR